MSTDPSTILFFDGVCNLCNGFIDFLVRRDHKRKLRFAPLQGEAAKRLVPEYSQSLTSMVLYKDGVAYTESSGALLALAELGGIWSVGKALLIFPGFLRNFVYRLIAKNRYRVFGKKETCRVPTAEERELFLD